MYKPFDNRDTEFSVIIRNEAGVDKLLKYLKDHNINCLWNCQHDKIDKDTIMNYYILRGPLDLYLYFRYAPALDSFLVTQGGKCYNEFDYYTVDNIIKGGNKMFTKKDLKDGMVVETRKGNRYCVCGDKFIGFEGWLDSVSFNNSLECYQSSNDFIIDKVYDEIHRLNDMEYGKSLKLLWERKIPKEMTVTEIEKELGYPIKIVKE